MTLYFAEIFLFLFPNLRRFDVLIENEFAFSSGDIVDESGQQGSRRAMAMTRTVTVEDKNLMIEFAAINRDPYISAIEVQGVADVQIGSPTGAPIASPAPIDVPTLITINPTMAPANATMSEPTSSPTMSPKMPKGKHTDSPTPNSSAQTMFPTKSPSVPPTDEPSTLNLTTDAPTAASPETPAPTDASIPSEFEGLRINAGGEEFVDFLGNVWLVCSRY